MASLKFLLGILPETAKFEQREYQLRKDYEAFKAFENSDELKYFENLKTEVNSSEFKRKVNIIKSQKFRNTDEYRKELEYLRLKKSKPNATFFEVLNSDKLREFELIEKSTELKRYQELKEYLLSDAFIKEKALLKSSDYRKSEAGLKEKEYKETSRSSVIKRYFRFNKSRRYRVYLQVKDSDELKRYKELERYVHSDEFLKVKTYMNLSGKEKYELSEENRKVEEFRILTKSDKISWFNKTRKNYPFGYVEKWELNFEDTFKGPTLAKDKWLTRYLFGDRTFNKNYVMADDCHAFTDGKNLEFFDKKLRILTKRQASKALVWDVQRGFYEKDFGFTSDLIISGDNFRQKYGLIEAKIKIAPSSVTQSLSLLADGILPHIDVFKYEKRRIYSGNFWKNGSSKGFNKSVSKTAGSKFTKDYFIYSLEWLPGKITWKINGEVFKVQNQGSPDVPMYLMLNSSLKEKAGEEGIPSALEIDWVRVYKMKE